MALDISLGNYSLSIGNPALGGIHWWLSIEKRWHTWRCNQTNGRHYNSKPVFRFQYHDIRPTYSNPRGGRRWVRVC